jgi:uncharacterized protein (UPF0179 family)
MEEFKVEVYLEDIISNSKTKDLMQSFIESTIKEYKNSLLTFDLKALKISNGALVARFHTSEDDDDYVDCSLDDFVKTECLKAKDKYDIENSKAIAEKFKSYSDAIIKALE